MTPGEGWLAIARERDPVRFAAAFVAAVRLDLAVMDDPMTGTGELRRYLTASRGMFQAIAFTHQADAGGRTYLTWEGRFADRDIAGATVLVRNAEGAIVNVQIYHRPRDQAVAFSKELTARLEALSRERPPVRERSVDPATTASTIITSGD